MKVTVDFKDDEIIEIESYISWINETSGIKPTKSKIVHDLVLTYLKGWKNQ